MRFGIATAFGLECGLIGCRDLDFVTADFDHTSLADIGLAGDGVTVDFGTASGRPILDPQLTVPQADTAMDVGYVVTT